MPTFTLVTSSVPTLTQVESNNTGTIYVATANAAYSIVANTGSITNLGYPGADAVGGTMYIRAFNGSLYAAWMDASPFDVGVSVWNGSTWNRVYTKPSGAVGSVPFGPFIGLRNSILLLQTSLYDGSSNLVTPMWLQSSNGSSWTTVTVNNANDIRLQVRDYIVGNQVTIDAITYSNYLLSLWDSNLYPLSSSNLSAGSGYSNYGSTYPRFITATPGVFWRRTGATTSEYGASLSSWVSTPVGDNGTMYPIKAINMPWVMGYYYNGVSAYAQKWMGSSWETGVYDVWSASSYGLPQYYVRMNDGKVYILTSGGSGGPHLLARNTNIAESPNWETQSNLTGTIFYYGFNNLVNQRGL